MGLTAFCIVRVCCCSVPQPCLTLCDPMDCSTPDFPVLHCLSEFAQTHVHCVEENSLTTCAEEEMGCWAEGVDFRTLGLTINRPLRGVTLPSPSKARNSGSLCPSLYRSQSPVVYCRCQIPDSQLLARDITKNINSRRQLEKLFLAKPFCFCKTQLRNTGSKKGGGHPLAPWVRGISQKIKTGAVRYHFLPPPGAPKLTEEDRPKTVSSGRYRPKMVQELETAKPHD